MQKLGGVVWAYFGAADQVPEFQPPLWAPSAEARVSIVKAILPCNWAQILEGAIDSAHSSNLHSSDMVPARVGGAEDIWVGATVVPVAVCSFQPVLPKDRDWHTPDDCNVRGSDGGLAAASAFAAYQV